MRRRRLTREQQKAQTKERLLRAAEKVLGRRGYHEASVEEVAEEAGFSRGAVYSNFESKEDLFFAVFDSVLEKRLPLVYRAVESKAGSAAPEAAAYEAGSLFTAFMGEKLEWYLVLIEFCSHAAKRPELRPKVAARLAALQQAIAELIEAQSEELGMPLPAPSGLLAATVISLTDGFALRRLIDPEAFPVELHQSALALFFAGMVALSKNKPPPAKPRDGWQS